MTAFAIAVRMTRAHLAGQRSDGAGSLSAVFAGVFRGFIALIESVSALADSVRMTGACGAGQRLDARISVPAVFAVKLRHVERFLFACLLNSEDATARRLVGRSFVLSGWLVGLSG